MSLDAPLVTMETQSAFMAASASAVLLAAVLYHRRDRTALLFAALILAFGLYSYGRGAPSLGDPRASLIAGLGLALLGALAPCVAASLTGRTRLLQRLLPLTVLGPLALMGALLSRGAEQPLVHAALHLWAWAGVVSGAALLLRVRPEHRVRHTPDATRLRYLAIAHVIVALAATLDLALWKLQAPRVVSLLAPLLYLYAGYLHLARVRVADLRQLMGNTVALTLMALGLAGSFAAIRIWVGTRLDLFVFNSFVASFALLLFYPRVRDRIQHLMDRYFMASKLELERALGGLRGRLSRALTLDELLKDLVAALEQTRRVRSSAIFLRNPPHLGFQQAASTGLPTRTRVNLIRDPEWIEALANQEGMLYEELEKALAETRSETDRARLQALCRTMRNLDAQLVLPFHAGTDLVGFWTLTESSPSEPFSSSEVRLLRSLADQIALSIEKSKTFERIRARDRLANLGEMAAGLAHEIRNPLATIRGALAVLDDPDRRTGPDAEFDRVIVQEIERLDRVVATFLDYARPGSRPSPLHDLEELVRGCVRSLGRQHADQRVQLSVQVKGQIPPILADIDQLERVIMNLLQNAHEAIEGPGWIRVTLEAEGGGPGQEHAVEISVRDNGCGMDDATLERVFIPFFTTKDSGLGLGLALCEKWVRSQEGTIQVSSKPGEGTLVRVRLPRGSGAGPPGEEPE